MRHRQLVAVAALTGTFVLTGCLSWPGGSQQSAAVEEMRAIAGGDCFAGSAAGLDFSAQVPCSEEHTFEVLDAFPAPPELADVSFEEAVDYQTQVGQEIYGYTLDRCWPALATMSGLSATVGTVPELAGEAGLRPGIMGTIAVVTAPERIWPSYQGLFCVIQWVDTDLNATAITSESSRPALASFGAADTPDEVRLCQTYDNKAEYLPVPCSEPHTAEVLFTFDASAVLGADWVGAVDPYALTEENLSAMDAVCGAAAPAVFGSERTLIDVVILAELYFDSWGTESSGGKHEVTCLAVASDQTMVLDGPVWGLGDVPVALAPAPVG